MLSKIPESAIENDLYMAEEVADLCNNIAKWALQSNKTELAIEWLQRASKMLKILDTRKSDFDFRRIHLAVLQTLGKSYPGSPGCSDLENEVMADLGRNTEAFQSQAMETMKIIQKVELVNLFTGDGPLMCQALSKGIPDPGITARSHVKARPTKSSRLL